MGLIMRRNSRHRHGVVLALSDSASGVNGKWQPGRRAGKEELHELHFFAETCIVEVLVQSGKGIR